MIPQRPIAERLALTLYSALLRLLTPAVLLRYWWRGRAEPTYRVAMLERLGLYAMPAPQGALWVHAVSLGETRAAAALIAALRNIRPGMRLLLTQGTATGRDAGRALLVEGDVQAWLPLDTPGAVRRFLAHFRPALGVLMETELWPNLLHAAQREGVAVVLANARLSAKSQSKGERFAALLRPAVRSLRLVLAQTDADARRLAASGAPKIEIAGNLKFDMTPDATQWAQGRAWRNALGRPVVLAASTREGEEAPLLAAWRACAVPRPLLLIVPRHPQRFDEVAALVRASGFALVRRSEWPNPTDASAATATATAPTVPTAPTALTAPAPHGADVLLGDSMGEMALYCASAHVALLGGSFAPFGGQNLIEAAACGCPVVMGPSTFNFHEAAELAVAAGAATRVSGIVEGVASAVASLGTAQLAARAEAARAFATLHRGSAQRMAGRIESLLAPQGARR